MYPSITPGEDRIFFSRSKNDEEIKKPKESPQCQFLLMALKEPNEKWGQPVVLHDGINRSCEYSPSVCLDGKTLFFASIDQENYKESYNPYFTREILQDNWLIPIKVTEASSEFTSISPVYINENLYFLRKWNAKKIDYGSIFKVPLPSTYSPLKTLNSTGKIVSQAQGIPLKAKLTVFEPTTLKIIGTYYSDEKTGIFDIPLLDGYNYIVDVRKHGYSFASFMIDFREAEKKYAPETIELFQEIDLIVSVYDNEIFKPLDAEVFIKDNQDGQRTFKGTMVEPGIYSFSLPMGTEYTVEATANWFVENNFNFDLTGDIVFSRFERNLPLVPKKRSVEITIADSETEEGVAAEVMIRNLNRDETIFFSAEDVKNGKVTAMLREGDEYEFTIRGAQGYSFHNQVVDMGKQETETFVAELVPLKAQTSIVLNNINFGTNSAELSPESFPELDRVVHLMQDNPNIVIEISAHSDNVGSAWYNQTLSEKRAQSVVNYLLDFEVQKERIVAKGYGMSKPMVPNTSDENRALNRRVEFKIIDIVEEKTEQEG
jgi:outer membrane protein OmpA-like peptidoglycan-associated protein